MATASFKVKENESFSLTFRDGKIELSIDDKSDHDKAAAEKNETDKDDAAAKRNGSARRTGPCGGTGGVEFGMDANLDPELCSIRIRHGLAIDSLQVVYDNEDDVDIRSRRWGGGGGKQDSFTLGAGEHLVSISGHYGQFKSSCVVRSLRFVSNLRSYGPYGTEEGVPFTLMSTKNGKIVGFHGRFSDFLDSIGILDVEF